MAEIKLVRVDNNFNQVRKETINVPVIGKVAAGQPLLAVENTEGYFPVPAEFLPNQPTFMLVFRKVSFSEEISGHPSDSRISSSCFRRGYLLYEAFTKGASSR